MIPRPVYVPDDEPPWPGEPVACALPQTQPGTGESGLVGGSRILPTRAAPGDS